MLIEVKTKATFIIDGKPRKKCKTFIIDKELFAEAEIAVMELYHSEFSSGFVTEYEILSLKKSPIKEVYTQYDGQNSYITTLKDIFLDNNGNEKPIKYKVLFWANDENEAMSNIREIMSQGYDMHFAGLSDVNYEFLNNEETQTISED